MLVASLVGALVFIAFLVGDWYYFSGMTARASRYGYGIARLEDRLQVFPSALNLHPFDQRDILQLPHGIARLFPEERHILLRPHNHLFSLRIRTVWPMKATIHLQPAATGTHVVGVKRIPWSSAFLTVAWLITVTVGTVGYIIAFLLNEGFSSFGGVLLGVGVTALGFVVLAFGLVTVALAYRLENQRLTEVYQELLQVLAPSPSS